MDSRKNYDEIRTVFNNKTQLANVVIKFFGKRRGIFVRWFDSVPRAKGFQTVKFTAEESRRTQPRLST